MAINYEQLGKRICHLRNKKNLSQEKLGEQIGISRESVTRIETGKKAPSVDTFVDIANTLEVSADDLLVDSLQHSSSNAGTELHQLLLDCNETEEKILIELIKYMKTVLYRLGI